MAFVIADRVREIWTGSGTGTMTLGGAATGYRTVGSVMATGDVSHFLITDGTAWEVDLCTYTTSGNTLARTRVMSNSAGTNVAISFGSTSNKAVVLLGSARQSYEAFFGQRGRIDGLKLTRPSTTTISVATGAARSSDNLSTIYLAAAITGKILQASGSWTAGSSANGLDTGAIAASTWYHVYAIENSTTGVCDVILSLSASAPAFPTGYDKARIIGSVRTDASTHLIDFIQQGDSFYWKAPLLDVNATTPGTAGSTVTLSVPLGLVTQPLISATGNDSGADGRLSFMVQPGMTLAAGSAAGVGVTATPAAAGVPPLLTNTSSQITVAGATATTTASIVTYGFIHPRGKDA